MESESFVARAAAAIGTAIKTAVDERGTCSLMLAGGTTMGPIYRYLAADPTFSLRNVECYFGDERCVPPDHVESNYRNARMLFSARQNDMLRVYRMPGEDPDRVGAARAYDSLLPDTIDVLLLGMGVDGHVASLFPGSKSLKEVTRRVIAVTGNLPPMHRLTISPPVIQAARKVIVFAAGKEKGAVLAEALRDPIDVASLPVRFTIGGEWVLDDAAKSEFSTYSGKE